MTCEGDLLWLRAKKTAEQKDERERHRFREIASSEFIRSIRLPAQADTSKVSAKIQDGVLNVVIQKSSLAAPKNVPVS